jgi:hypothetical protein
MMVVDFATQATLSQFSEIDNVQFVVMSEQKSSIDFNLGETYLGTSEAKELESHFKVIKDFLTSNHEHLLIFDSSKITSVDRLCSSIKAILEYQFDEIDLLQFKYVTKRFRLEKPVYDSTTFMGDLGIYIGRNLASIDLIYRNWIQLSRFFYRATNKSLWVFSKVVPVKLTKKISSRVSGLGHVSISRGEYALRKALNLEVPLIYHSFEKGLDCYLVSRKFATAILTVNNPALVNLNLIYSACARTQNLVSIRVGKNFV